MATATRGSYRRALRHADLRWLFGALTVSVVGSWAYNIAIVAYVYEQTHSAGWVGAVALGRFVPSLLCSSYGGVVAERFERVNLMVFIDLLGAITMVAMAATMAASGPPAVVIALAAITSVVGTAYQPATAAMLPQLAGEDDLAAANALNAAIENVTILAGPALAGLLLTVVSPAAVTGVNAATFLVSAVMVSRVRARSVPTDVTRDGGALRQVLVGVRAITTSSSAALLVGFSVLASFVYGTDTVVFVVVSQERLGTGANYGYLLGAMGAGGVLGALLVNRLASSTRLGLIITLGMLVYCVPTAALVVVHSPTVAAVLVAVRGAGTVVVDTLAVTALQRALPPDLIARVFGVFFALVLGAISLGALLTPALLAATSLDTTLLVLGVGLPAVVVLAVPWTTSIDREGARRLAVLRPRLEVLEGLGLLAGASRATLERLASAAVDVLQPDGHRDVVVEGEPATALWVLVDGEVEVRARGEATRTRQIRTLQAPSYFGEIGLLQQIPRTATVRTLGPCRFLRIDGPDFLSAVTETAPSAALLQSVATRMARTHPSRRVELPAQREPAETAATVA